MMRSWMVRGAYSRTHPVGRLFGCLYFVHGKRSTLGSCVETLPNCVAGMLTSASGPLYSTWSSIISLFVLRVRDKTLRNSSRENETRGILTCMTGACISAHRSSQLSAVFCPRASLLAVSWGHTGSLHANSAQPWQRVPANVKDLSLPTARKTSLTIIQV